MKLPILFVLLCAVIGVFGKPSSCEDEDLKPCRVRQSDIDKLKDVDVKKLVEFLEEKIGDGPVPKVLVLLVAAASKNRLLAPAVNAVAKITVVIANDGGILDQLLSGGEVGATLDPVTTRMAHEIWDGFLGKCVINELIRIGGALQHNPLLKILPLKTLFPLLAGTVGTVKSAIRPIFNLVGSIVRPLLNEHNGHDVEE